MGYVLVVKTGLVHGQKYSTAKFKFAKTPTLALLGSEGLISGAARLAEVRDVRLLMRSARKCQLTFPPNLVPCDLDKLVLMRRSQLVTRRVSTISLPGRGDINPENGVPSLISHMIDSVQPLHLCGFLSLLRSSQSSLG